MKKISLISKIFIFLFLGIILGLTCKKFNFTFPINTLNTFSVLFGNFLSFIIPLIIIGFIVPGIASLGNKSGGTLLITVLVAYISTIFSGICAFFAGKTLLPKLLYNSTLINESTNSLYPFFTIDIPPIMSVMSALVFAFIFGIGISKIKNSMLLKVAEEFSYITSLIISKILIPLVPVYICCIFAKLSYNGEIFSTLKSFAIVYVILFLLQISYIIIQFIISGIIKNTSPLKLLKNMLPAYITALGTQSSAATIPITLECVKKNGVSKNTREFVVPLAATIHIAGDTITLVLTSMAVMYMNGRVPTIELMLPFIFMLAISMVAAPGVPGGGVMAALGLLESMLGFGGLEKSIMISLHAAQDSFGTATNVTCDGSIAIIVDYLSNKLNKTSNTEIFIENNFNCETNPSKSTL
ncbi:dicarboxylate/amino acid:cation symporter [Clostridium tarantellae]|uniref:Cation:dicarboxylase symporter family transporter n=1 Tax=Clostridium tarantellae TaxID=39493 RepID=A0A6I1MR59_9CLOT|nr:dicarboxylate/amino acid:cation symporter [Clostridium tarantellae]MPQ44702.1 cation:dicarboxylase symporter family transporter [Clostridium tarantellae]